MVMAFMMAVSMEVLTLLALTGSGMAATPQALLQHLWTLNDHSVPADGHTRSAVPKTYTLRLCNAYAWSAPLEMRRLQEPKLVEYPLPYTECHDYMLPLSNGDELQFRAGDLNIGTFSVQGLPKTPTMLLLVPHRRSSESMAVIFDSHMYAQGSSPQVALVDAYTGPHRSSLVLREKEHREELRFNSVVTLTPGDYAVNLATNATDKLSLEQFKARHEERYVVIRVGNGDGPDEPFPEHLVVFPQISGTPVRGTFQIPILIGLAMLMTANER